mgnify:CR=1 FL=1
MMMSIITRTILFHLLILFVSMIMNNHFILLVYVILSNITNGIDFIILTFGLTARCTFLDKKKENNQAILLISLE